MLRSECALSKSVLIEMSSSDIGRLTFAKRETLLARARQQAHVLQNRVY